MTIVCVTLKQVAACSIAGVLTLAASAGPAFKVRDALPVPQDAYDVGRYDLRTGDAQLSFFIDLPYPREDVLTFYADFFRERGWKRQAGPGVATSWQSFIDGVSEPPRQIDRHEQRYLSADGLLCSLVAVQYSSPEPVSLPLRPPPHTQQFAFILIWRRTPGRASGDHGPCWQGGTAE